MPRKSRDTAQTAVGFNNGVQVATQVLPNLHETCDSVGHNLRKLGKVDCGGPFLLSRDNWSFQLSKSLSGKWRGSDLIISGGPGAYNHPAVPSDASQLGTGATAISRCIPSAPVANGLVALRELRSDGLPSIPVIQSWRNKAKEAMNPGNEYLNVAFGWAPFVADIKDFCRAVTDSNDILKEYKAGSGKITRAGYQFPDTDVSDSWSGNCFLYRAGNSGISASVSAAYTVYQRSQTWFNGAFKYHLPVSDSQMGKMALYASYADKLLGIKPTPANLWASSPWTWGLDWFANYGDVLTNMSLLGQNGMVMLYGYLMSSTSTKETITIPGNLSPSAAFGGYTGGSRTRVREFKKRLPAHPYGFGVTDASLNLQQQAVLVALGITHGHGGHG